MEMPEPVKKYWPYLLGGAVGLFLLLKSSSGNSSSGGSTDYASLLAAQSAASASQGQLGLQASALQDQTQVQLAQVAGQSAIATTNANASLTIAGYQRDTALAATAAAVNDSNNAAQIGFISAQAQLAANAGQASAGIITALQAPDIVAINDATAYNIATVQSAAGASVAAYGSSAAIYQGTNQTTAIVGSTLAPAGGINSQGAIAAISGASGTIVGAQAGGQAKASAAESAADAAKSQAAWSTIGTFATAALAVA